MGLYDSYALTTVFGAAGVARAQYAIVNHNGYPMGSTGTIGNGQTRGMGIHAMVKRSTSRLPGPRNVNATGDNGRKRLKFVFPAEDLGTFEMNFGAFDLNALAAFSGTKVQQIGDWALFGLNTDADPETNQICLLFNVDAEDAGTLFGNQRWLNMIVPLCNVYAMGASLEEAAAAEWGYTVSPVQATQTPWGIPFTGGNNGFANTALFGLTSRNPMTMDTFISDGSNSVATLTYRPTEDQTGNAVQCWRNGSPIALTAVNIAAHTATMASPGTAGDVNVFLYESIATDLLA